MRHLIKATLVATVLLMDFAVAFAAKPHESSPNRDPATITQNDIKRIRNEVAQYAKNRGETEIEFAQRVNDSPNNIEAFVWAVEQDGGTAEGALKSLEGLSSALNNSENSSPSPSQLKLPQYDVEGWCKRFDNPQYHGTMNSCIRGIQQDYDYLKESWPTISEAIKADCIAKNYQPSESHTEGWLYQRLAGCVRQEISIKELRNQPQFHY
jgi:uncharacterized phage infection (PIP) family protein YhgE